MYLNDIVLEEWKKLSRSYWPPQKSALHHNPWVCFQNIEQESYDSWQRAEGRHVVEVRPFCVRESREI